MPLISSFYGMYIKMYFQRKEHNPPHFHVIYGEYTGEIEIKSVNVPPPTEAGASCFNENSTTAPRNCCGLHSLHRRRFPCDPRYFMNNARQIFA